MLQFNATQIPRKGWRFDMINNLWKVQIWLRCISHIPYLPISIFPYSAFAYSV